MERGGSKKQRGDKARAASEKLFSEEVHHRDGEDPEEGGKESDPHLPESRKVRPQAQ